MSPRMELAALIRTDQIRRDAEICNNAATWLQGPHEWREGAEMTKLIAFTAAIGFGITVLFILGSIGVGHFRLHYTPYALQCTKEQK